MKRVGAIKTVNPEVSSGIPSSPHAAAHHDSRFAEMLPGSKYPQPLSLYGEPPLCEVTIEEFEELALNRLERTYKIFIYLSYL